MSTKANCTQEVSYINDVLVSVHDGGSCVEADGSSYLSLVSNDSQSARNPGNKDAGGKSPDNPTTAASPAVTTEAGEIHFYSYV